MKLGSRGLIPPTALSLLDKATKSSSKAISIKPCIEAVLNPLAQVLPRSKPAAILHPPAVADLRPRTSESGKFITRQCYVTVLNRLVSTTISSYVRRKGHDR